MIRFLTAGESHGIACTVIVEGMPAGLCVPKKEIEYDLIRRQVGYCRGWRQAIEENRLEITSGIHNSITSGAPISITIYNTEGVNNPVWQMALSAYPDDVKIGSGKEAVPLESAIKEKQRSILIPGHADLAGIVKYRHKDNNLRFISDRASARETTVRVAVGAIAKLFLSVFGISISSYVTQIGHVRIKDRDIFNNEALSIKQMRLLDDLIVGKYKEIASTIEKNNLSLFNVSEKDFASNKSQIIKILYEGLAEFSDCSKVRCPDEIAAKEMVMEINNAREKGDTLGGVFRVVANNLPIGLGSYVHYDRRLDSKLGATILSIPAVKGVEFGKGFESAGLRGSEMHDPISLSKDFFSRDTNNAGGLEAGMTNGEPLVIYAAVKPISMISKKGIKTVDINSGNETLKTSGERADICAVPSAAVIAESLVAIELANAMIEKFGGDHISEIMENHENYKRHLADFYKGIKIKRSDGVME